MPDDLAEPIAEGSYEWWRREVERLRKERDALKAATNRVWADAEMQRRETGTTHDRWQLGVYAQACRTLCILRDALDPPDDRDEVARRITAHRVTEQDGGIPNDAITPADLRAAHHPTDTTGDDDDE